MSALYLVIANPLDLLNSMMVVHNASAIYPGEDPPNLRQFFIQPLKRIGFRGPLVTSMYSLVLSCLTLLVIVSFASGGHCMAAAAYLSRGAEKGSCPHARVLHLQACLRLSCLYIARHGRGSGLVASTVVQVCLMCLGNVVKWSVFTVYYCDCKQRFLKKKTDVEEGKADPPVKS
ncbi:hypothetical protein EUGRSUZ_L03458 [Eucalyptus grandis]|uniref:Uncharacterized protein n=1 Tax=Eucalyptus grandis TaxID=71139 RepID=A0AAD9WIB7_EUCGR|nr:hypothetical protein EUGRSUZ_L03458 [Eucalyptus grandis]